MVNIRTLADKERLGEKLFNAAMSDEIKQTKIEVQIWFMKEKTFLFFVGKSWLKKVYSLQFYISIFMIVIL